MSARHPWPPALPPQPTPLPIPGKRRLGGDRVLVVLHDTATTQDRIAAARQLLAGTGLTLAAESRRP